MGATWNGTSAGKMASYSSRGPAYDGRIKPTVVAPGGDSITADGPSPVKAASTSSSDEQCGSDPANRYHPTGGTSFAHPAVAGSAALVRQYFTDGWYPSGVKTPSQWINPSAALIKAVLVNSAVQLTDNSAYEQLCVFCSDCPHPHYDCSYTYNYPNKIQGWGRILLENSLYFSGDSRGLMVVDDSSGLANSGDVKEYSIQVTDSTPVEPLKATLVWSDYPATAGTSGPALQNNLDLVVKDPACTAYNGNHFSSGIASQSLPGGSNDARNVEEEVLLGSPSVPPTPGIWAVSVRAANIVQAYQPFALVATGKVGRYLLTAAGDEMTGLETIVSGSYVNTQASDDVYEVLQEVLQGDVSVLEHVWRFDNVSPCRSTLTLRLEGNRPSNPDGDNFKFYWSDSLNGTYTEIPNAVISLPAELQGGIDYPFAWPGTSSTIYIKVKDTHQEPGSGSSLDRLNIDFLQIR